jgi:predicted ATPase
MSETSEWNNPFKFGLRRSALGNLPDDEKRFPVGMWFRNLLADGVQVLRLNSEAMRRPCPPGSPRAFQPDGSNLPLVVEQLSRENPDRMDAWAAHLRTCLPNVQKIRTVIRPHDLNSYLVVTYGSGLEVPSWSLSDGTLRVLAMTLLAYVPDLRGPILIEEPENGIHPKAIETVYQSLRSIYDVQVLAATHSPVIVGLAKPEDLLCFGLTEEGAAVAISGDDHPRLKDWQEDVDLGTFFAGGVLG